MVFLIKEHCADIELAGRRTNAINGSLMDKGLGLVEKLIGQSCYRVDVYECTEFLNVLCHRAVESLSAMAI